MYKIVKPYAPYVFESREINAFQYKKKFFLRAIFICQIKPNSAHLKAVN